VTGRARQRAHRAAARAAVRSDRWNYQSEHEQNQQVIRARAVLGSGSKVTAFFLTNERRATRVLRNFLKAL